MTQNSSRSPRWSNWVRPEGIGILEKMGFWDSSWGNDACPSWTHDGVDLQIYIDLPIPYSEVQDNPSEYMQYMVTKASLYGELGAHILATNDIDEVEAYIQKEHCITGPDGQHACQANGNPCACYCNECECLTDYP